MGSVKVLIENCDATAAEDRGLPSNSYLVTYLDEEQNKKQDITQGGQVDIFDYYYDKYKNLQALDWTNGTVNPKLYGYKPAEEKKKKR
tara:strand:- start:798 stop:1061 length:264 start_codon:yes stop_codon:yes gene_type:complete